MGWLRRASRGGASRGVLVAVLLLLVVVYAVYALRYYMGRRGSNPHTAATAVPVEGTASGGVGTAGSGTRELVLEAEVGTFEGGVTVANRGGEPWKDCDLTLLAHPVGQTGGWDRVFHHRVEGVDAGSVIEVPYDRLRDKDDAPYDPATFEPTTFALFCTTRAGKALWHGRWDAGEGRFLRGR